jgi:signal transduction histidine kinase
LLSLIQDVLSFAKLESGRVEVNIAPVPVHPLLTELEALFQPQVEAGRLTLRVGTCPASLEMMGDVERVRQVLINLLTNAVKFTPAGGTVDVECVADAGRVRITVRDTGPGIPPEKLEEIFAPFVQLQRDAAGSQAGTGLGLAISRDLARAMNADLVVESQVGKGSAFTLIAERASG